MYFATKAKTPALEEITTNGFKSGITNYFNSTFGVPKVEKSEIRISKSETNSNFLMFK
jgi:hypothetical protein